MTDPRRHRYALEELLNELPPGWTADEGVLGDDGDGYYRPGIKPTEVYFDGHAWRATPRVSPALSESIPFGSPHAAMAAVDDALEQRGLLDG